MYKFDNKDHTHTLRGKPLTGTSSIGDVLFKPLHWWSAELAAVECLEKGIKIEGIREEYEQAIKGDKKKGIDELQKKYPIFKKARFAHHKTKDKAAKEGTDTHDIYERWVKSQMGKDTKITDEEQKQIKPFIEWADKNVKEFVWSEANCYSERLWVGGISDAGAILKDGTLAVIDFKRASKVYITHYIQVAGYAIEVEENGIFSENGKHNKKINNKVGKLIIVPGDAIPQITDKVDEYKQGFESAVSLYRLMGLHKNGNN